MKQTKAKLKNSSPKQKMGLHHFIALGGDPKDYEGAVESAAEERAEKERGEEK